MTVDYSGGRYSVFSANGALIGRIDEDEFIRVGPTLKYRLDGTEVYAMNGESLAIIDNGVARTTNGQVLFSIQRD